MCSDACSRLWIVTSESWKIFCWNLFTSHQLQLSNPRQIFAILTLEWIVQTLLCVFYKLIRFDIETAWIRGCWIKVVLLLRIKYIRENRQHHTWDLRWFSWLQLRRGCLVESCFVCWSGQKKVNWPRMTFNITLTHHMIVSHLILLSNQSLLGRYWNNQLFKTTLYM